MVMPKCGVFFFSLLKSIKNYTYEIYSNTLSVHIRSYSLTVTFFFPTLNQKPMMYWTPQDALEIKPQPFSSPPAHHTIFTADIH